MKLGISLIPLLAAGGAGGEGSNFLALYGNASANAGRSVATDADDNIVLVGDSGISTIGTSDGFVVKLDKDGNELWAKAVGNGSETTAILAVATDSNGDVICAGHSTEPPYGGADSVILKLDGADGSIVWQREVGGAGTNDRINALHVDSSDNIYAAGWDDGGARSWNGKWNSSGTLQWQRTMANAGSTLTYSMAGDASGNTVTICNDTTLGDGVVYKRNASGTLQWQRRLQATVDSQGAAIDSSGNVYVASNNSTLLALSKINSSGTLVWTRQITGVIPDYPAGVALDENEDVFVASRADSGTSGFLGKWNASGTIQWQADVDAATSGNTQFYDMVIDTVGRIVAAGRTSADGAGNFDALIARLPPDGSGTGTYGGLVYATTSLTEAAGGVTLATPSLTDAAGSLTEAAAGLSVADLALTLEVLDV